MKIDIWKTENRYGVIEADPPWNTKRGGKKAVRPSTSGEPLPYETMSYADIHNVLRQAYDLLEDNGVLFLWAIEKNLNQVEIMAKAIGFKLHARMIWDKTPYKGKLLSVAKEQRGKTHSVFRESPVRGGHSTKPKISKEIMERLYPKQKKLELFARRTRKGWDCWGDQSPEDTEQRKADVKTVINDSQEEAFARTMQAIVKMQQVEELKKLLPNMTIVEMDWSMCNNRKEKEEMNNGR